MTAGQDRPAPEAPAGIPTGAAHSPAPVGSWAPDLLGPGFESRTLPLLPDEEDDGSVATLVRHVPALDPQALAGTPTTPSFCVLYIHGWNDYFFQTGLARELARLGAAFHALDLRRFGRSWRQGQMRGWTRSLSAYDEEIGLALARIHRDHGWDMPVVLMAHSEGGLIASLWADRHPGAVSALVLNSPWLELQGTEPMRLVGEGVIRSLARRDPRRPIPVRSYRPEDLFWVTDGWSARDGELPDPAWAEDPYVTGIELVPGWREKPSWPVRPGWLQAVIDGQAHVAASLDIRCPVLVLASAASHLSIAWSPLARSTDTVIDADATARRAVRLGALVTVARFDGAVHDVVLSAPPVREQVYSALRLWLAAYALPGPPRA